MSEAIALRVLFDESHGERGRINLDYSQLAGILRRNGFRVETFQGHIEELSLKSLVQLAAIVL
ncbi:MAG: hypothetical protein ACTSVM_02105, partial [Candidatus Ranarchaeia archaeon]